MRPFARRAFLSALACLLLPLAGCDYFDKLRELHELQTTHQQTLASLDEQARTGQGLQAALAKLRSDDQLRFTQQDNELARARDREQAATRQCQAAAQQYEAALAEAARREQALSKQLTDATAAAQKAEADARRREQAILDQAAADHATVQTLEERRSAVEKLLRDRDELARVKDQKIAALEEARDALKASYDELSRRVGKTPAAPATDALPPRLLERLRAWVQVVPGLAELPPGGNVVCLSADLTFGPGTDDIVDPAATALSALGAILRSPEAEPYALYIVGHTDDTPIRKPEMLVRHPDNWYLSVHRALLVKRALVRAGLDETRVGVVGFGPVRPLAASAAPAKGTAANRRVELWLLPRGRFL
jgi:chemotaxis protein MotB